MLVMPDLPMNRVLWEEKNKIKTAMGKRRPQGDGISQLARKWI